jgi:hypothetical protein
MLWKTRFVLQINFPFSPKLPAYSSIAFIGWFINLIIFFDALSIFIRFLEYSRKPVFVGFGGWLVFFAISLLKQEIMPLRSIILLFSIKFCSFPFLSWTIIFFSISPSSSIKLKSTYLRISVFSFRYLLKCLKLSRTLAISSRILFDWSSSAWIIFLIFEKFY